MFEPTDDEVSMLAKADFYAEAIEGSCWDARFYRRGEPSKTAIGIGEQEDRLIAARVKLRRMRGLA